MSDRAPAYIPTCPSCGMKPGYCRAWCTARPSAAADRAKAAELVRQVWWAGAVRAPSGPAVDEWAAALAAARADARRDQQLWDRKRVEDYAETVGVALTPGDDLGDAINELYLAACAAGEAAATQRWTTARDALAEELAGDSKDAMKRADAARKRGQESGARELYTANVRHARVAAHAAAALRGLVPTSSEEEGL